MRRGDIPEALADPSLWPTVDVTALTGERRDIYQRREQAVCAYLRDESRIDIEQRFGVNRGSLIRLVARCLSPLPGAHLPLQRPLLGAMLVVLRLALRLRLPGDPLDPHAVPVSASRVL